MYKYHPLPDLIKRTNAAMHGKSISIYVDCDPDYVSADMVIDPYDEKGLEIFREFAARMAEHYKSLTT